MSTGNVITAGSAAAAAGGLAKKGIVTSDADAGEGIYTLNATAAYNFTLPAATGTQERRVFIAGTVSATNKVTIAVQTGESLNGTLNGTQVIDTPDDVFMAIDAGTGKWEIWKDTTAALNPATIVSPAANDPTGLVGTSTNYAREDHKHPAQGVAPGAGNLLVNDGVSGLAYFDGRPTAFLSTSTFTPADPANPTLAEVAAASPKFAMVYYTGTSVSTDTPTHVYWSDSAGSITKLLSPIKNVVEIVVQTAHGFALKDIVYHNGTSWVKAIASAATSVGQAVVTNVISANSFEITTHGIATITGHGLTAGSYYYLSQATAGLATATAPTTGLSQSILFVRDANTVFIDVEQPIDKTASGGTGTSLGRTGAFRTTTTNPGNGNAVAFETLSNSSIGLTEALLTAGTVDLVAGKTYKLSAGVRMETTASGFSHWYIRTTTGTNISPRIALDSSNSPTNNASISNTEIVYTPTTNETVGLYLDAASTIGDAGPGTYLNVEELPVTNIVTAAQVTITGAGNTGDSLIITNGGTTPPTAAWKQPTVNINTQTAGYTLVLSDAGGMINMNSTSPVPLTVPTNATVAFPIGTTIAVAQTGIGAVQVNATTGVTVNSLGGTVTTSGQYATASLLKIATDTWLLTGALI